jgi:parvulin-like peptidyl-prolyl isomerase
MEFIAEAAAAAVEPEEAELAEWFDAHKGDFTAPATIAFRQILLEAPDMAEATRGLLADGADPVSLGRATMLPGLIERGSQVSVDGAFGPGFYETVAALPIGEWVGPIESAFGSHLVLLAGMDQPPVPNLADIRGEVVAGWRRAKAEEFRTTQYEALRARYDISLPGDPE